MQSCKTGWQLYAGLHARLQCSMPTGLQLVSNMFVPTWHSDCAYLPSPCGCNLAHHTDMRHRADAFCCIDTQWRQVGCLALPSSRDQHRVESKVTG